MGGTRSSFGETTDVSRTKGLAVDDAEDTGFVSTVRVERMGDLAKSRAVIEFEGDLIGIIIRDVSSEVSWESVGCSTALGGYRETNNRSSSWAPSMSPDL